MQKTKKIHKAHTKGGYQQGLKAYILKDIAVDFDSFKEIYERVDISECISE